MGAGAEKMRGIEKPDPIVAAPVIGVLPICALADGAAVTVVSPVVGKHLAECVGRLELQAVAAALPAAHLQRVVIHGGAGVGAADISHQGQNAVFGLALYRRSPSG